MASDKGRFVLPETLQNLSKVENFPSHRHRWNTNEEIAAILISFDKHESWLSKEVRIRPQSGTMLLYSRKRVRYRRDGYCWKKRKDGKTTREDHMKLKVQGMECIYGCYVHSAILPTFHRRCYWLLENPDIVLVHYLNVPSADESKVLTSVALSQCAENKKWTKEELLSQLKPMFHTSDESDHVQKREYVTDTTVEGIVQQLIEKHHFQTSLHSQQRGTRERNISFKLAICPVSGREKRSIQNSQALNSQPTSSKVSNERSASKQETHDDVPVFQPKVQKMGTDNPRSVRPNSLKIINSSCRSSQEKSPMATSKHSNFLNTSPTSVIFSLSQIQGGGGLLILNNAAAVAGLGLTPTLNVTTPITGVELTPTLNTTTTITALGVTSALNTTTTMTALGPAPPLNTKTVVTGLEFNSTHNTTTGAIGLGLTSTQKTTLVATDLKLSPSQNTASVRSKLGFIPVQSTITTETGGRFNQVHNASLSGLGLTSSLRTTKSLSKFGNISNITVPKVTIKPGLNNRTTFLGLQMATKRSLDDSRTTKQHKSNTSPTTSFDNQLTGRESFLNIVSPKHTTNLIGLDSKDFLNNITFLSSASEAQPTGTVHHRGDQTAQTSKVTSGQRGSQNEHQRELLSAQESVAEAFSKGTQASTDDKNFEVTPMEVTNDAEHSISTMDDVFQYNSLSMLSDFSSLENPNSKHSEGSGSCIITSSSSSSPSINCSSHVDLTQYNHDHMVLINDYSPDWSYTEGGIKVLISGPWDSSNSLYTVLFDGVSVPTTLVQNGVLRCFCPAHDAAVVRLQVACEGRVISNSVSFEYHKKIVGTITSSTCHMDGQVLELSLMERLKGMESRLSIPSELPMNLCSDLPSVEPSSSPLCTGDSPGPDQKKVSTRTV
ncbi:calmodulin-binding transcription activator 1-like [Tachypleus tridentatus]|uniref:calmodulin-binding transcription activator 1-like n=1 Tax=Tachypleus tridentatus TaxID=6853 RepID=UPI003FD4AFD0